MKKTHDIYREALLDGRRRSGASLAGCWIGSTSFSVSELLAALEHIEQADTTTTLKEDRRTRVMLASLGGYRVVIKKYRLTKRVERLKYVFRISPARRFWAAARTMQQISIPTPQPLGMVEVFKGRTPVRSYVINEFMSDAVTSREWIEEFFNQQSASFKQAFVRDLVDMLLLCYQHSLYHKDTKGENILLLHPKEEGVGRFLWIDLECVQAKKPTRHDIIRNLVQLNGAIGLDISCDDRVCFLEQFAQAYPWVNQPAVVKKIKEWTAMRLAKEKVEA